MLTLSLILYESIAPLAVPNMYEHFPMQSAIFLTFNNKISKSSSHPFVTCSKTYLLQTNLLPNQSYKLHSITIMSLDSSFKVFWTILLLISFSNVSPQTINDLQSYIIQVKLPPKVTKQTTFSTSSRDNWYKSFLPTALASSLRRESRLMYSYNGIVDGFAARLTSEELDQLKNKSGFIHAYPDRLLPLQTTYSPAFLGLKQNSGLWRSSNFGQGVVIGMLDTGITPDHPSFSSRGMPEPPEKWKGSCEFDTFVCNNKIIGAKTFMRSINWFKKRSDKTGKVAGRLGPYDSRLGPYDDDGHGTHTASTAAGALVANASVNGQAKGTAAGVAPLAHLAIYKVLVIFHNC